ncbi:hypothetical protein EP331_06065 [bacterium]|nr:MAG: hypothetical protein EP331_06065 [bacterium]
MQEIISQILQAKQQWLFEQKELLDTQIQQTIEAGFNKSDVFHALRWINDRVTEEALINWSSKTEKQTGAQTKVLFFHAGNLPLVGFQDVIAALLANVRYYGKLSRKDPFLLSGFLNVLKQIQGNTSQLTYSTEIHDFDSILADKLVFSGSEEGSKAVLELAKSRKMIRDDAQLIMRTAHFSIARLRKNREESLNDVVESVLRYDGEGCRSVKMIIAPYGLLSNDCALVDQVDLWQMKNNQTHQQLSDAAKYYKAYYQSIDKPVTVWMNKIIVEHMPTRFEKDVIYWQKGDDSDINQIRAKYGNRIQCIYSDAPEFPYEEDLFYAQNPQLDWKPDGTDILEWLIS